MSTFEICFVLICLQILMSFRRPLFLQSKDIDTSLLCPEALSGHRIGERGYFYFLLFQCFINSAHLYSICLVSLLKNLVSRA